MLTLVPVLTAPAAAQGPVCEGYSGKNLLRGFGGANTFTKKPVQSPDGLLQAMRQHEQEVRSLMENHGVGNLTDDLFHAIETGEGLSERNVEPGDTFEWMAYRSRGQARVLEGACFAPKGRQTYPAYVVNLSETGEPGGPNCDEIKTTDYEFTIPKICGNLALENVEESVERLDPIPPPVCELTASRSNDPSRRISVDATGSSEGAVVTLGGREISFPTWTGDDANPYQEVVVTVRGENEDLCGRPQTCEETVRLEPYVRPECVITVTPDELRAGEDFTLNVDGNWRANGLEVTVRRDDTVVEEISHSSTGPLSQQMSLRSGDYVIEGVATNVIDDEATCRAEIEVVGGRWKVRPHFTYWDFDDDLTMFSGFDANTVPVREKFQVGDAFGVGVGLEYYFNDRIGLEGELEYAETDGTFVFDLGQDWVLDEDEAETFALFFGPNFHLTPNKRPDFYVGPIVGLVDIGSYDFQTFGVSTEANVDSEFTWGARVGVDVPFSEVSPWAFNASARWLNMSPDIELSNPLLNPTYDSDLDPITLSVGVAYGF